MVTMIDPQVNAPELSINKTTLEITLQFQVSPCKYKYFQCIINRAMIHVEGVILQYLLSLPSVWMGHSHLL